MAVAAILIFVGAYILLMTEWVHRTKVALVGAGLMLLLRINDAEHTFFAEDTGIDWNVLLLLLGMMVIVSVLRRTGVFEYVADVVGVRLVEHPGQRRVVLHVAGDHHPQHLGVGQDRDRVLVLVAAEATSASTTSWST